MIDERFVKYTVREFQKDCDDFWDKMRELAIRYNMSVDAVVKAYYNGEIITCKRKIGRQFVHSNEDRYPPEECPEEINDPDIE